MLQWGRLLPQEAFRSAASSSHLWEALCWAVGFWPAGPGGADKRRGRSALTSSRLAAFHQALYEGYCRAIPEVRNVLFKMKEMWTYRICMFPEADRYGKRSKAEVGREYEAAVARAASGARAGSAGGIPGCPLKRLKTVLKIFHFTHCNLPHYSVILF